MYYYVRCIKKKRKTTSLLLKVSCVLHNHQVKLNYNNYTHIFIYTYRKLSTMKKIMECCLGL